MAWLEQHRTAIIALFAVIILAGSAVFLYRQNALPHSTEIIISTPAPEIRVYVEGAVVVPGVYTLQYGGRVADAIEVAGGFTTDADPSTVDPGTRLCDGNRIYVYEAGAVPQKVNLNTAETWLLQALPGIGEILAQRIIDFRNENGPFQQIEDLKKIEGISSGTFDKLKDKITVH